MNDALSLVGMGGTLPLSYYQSLGDSVASREHESTENRLIVAALLNRSMTRPIVVKTNMNPDIKVI